MVLTPKHLFQMVDAYKIVNLQGAPSQPGQPLVLDKKKFFNIIGEYPRKYQPDHEFVQLLQLRIDKMWKPELCYPYDTFITVAVFGDEIHIGVRREHDGKLIRPAQWNMFSRVHPTQDEEEEEEDASVEIPV